MTALLIVMMVLAVVAAGMLWCLLVVASEADRE